MSADVELSEIAQAMEAMLARFSKDYHMADGDESEFKRLVVEAKDLLDQELGAVNNFSFTLTRTANDAVRNYLESPSYRGVADTAAVIRAGVNGVRRRTATPKAGGVSQPPYVDAGRLAAVRSASKAHWDLDRLAQLCQELNVAHANACYMSIAMLVRTITNHIPPVFGAKNFGDIANNLPGDQSFKKSMQQLDVSLRNIADSMLHAQVRSKESLPAATQVDFRAPLDRLLEEVVRRANTP